ncbi:FSR family fosmidomycin resistance protein-like MFS transporter [Symbiobacterium terraclitae]|uniref:FSR family fosmidomycin resistance protein-like MFS transporter n=1 Tax=Symbiobacterium terraclitae TaxID=557451 RepID=A0ABS4JUV1_9FIRM|nr:MFS transporter [Symbiobacterium terraclitae]MBP2019316.1 FSR family fosmidomycin resistance protein-like MFS transporter [Symbiobacterium terraclitae]
MNPATAANRPALALLLVLSLTHGVVDLTSGAIIALLPALREAYALSYGMVGLIPLFANLTSTFTQPVFGIISDRSEMRWLLPLSLALGGLGLAAVGFVTSYWLTLAAVVISALGSAAFHPEGAHVAHNLAGGRRALAMAIYNVGGNLGYALGPAFAAALIAAFGLRGTAWAAVLPLVLAAWLLRLLPRWRAHEQEAAARRNGLAGDAATNWKGTVLITLVVILRSVMHLGMATYLPFFWIDVLQNPVATAGLVQMTYLLAGVLGTLLGAPLADRFGTKPVLVASFALLLPLQAILSFLRGWPLLIVLFGAGFLVVSTFTTTLVMTQEYMPRSLGLASGLNLGLAFGMGGLGTSILGVVADHFGVTVVMRIIACLVIPALLLTLVLPPVRTSRE